MQEIFLIIVIIVSTIGLFLGMQKVYEKFPNPFLIPLLTVTVITAIVLVIFNIPYDTYMKGGELLQKVLGPAVVALAVPLYNQRSTIAKYKYSIITSIIVAMLSGLISVFVFLKILKVNETYILTALPKSLTTPVAMEVSSSIQGISPLTAVLVMVAGFTGSILGPYMYKFAKINTAISRGVSMGSAAHGVGISKLKEYGMLDLSIGSLSMGLSAVLGAFICPLFVLLFM